jgi:hypothetical protein
MRGLGVVSILVGLLAWSGPAQAVKPNPPGKQAGKFVVLGTGDVLDTTTSLRWQQTPGDDICGNTWTCTWFEAWNYCEGLGNGSRLPGVKELQGLVDYSVAFPGPTLPEGHPFVDEKGEPTVQSSAYWSATTTAETALGNAWYVSFFQGQVDFALKGSPSLHAWCVRGAQAYDGQNIVPPAP